MEIDVDTLIARQALRLNLLDEQQIHSAFLALGAGVLKTDRLGDAFVQMGILSQEQVDQILRSLQGNLWNETTALLNILRRHSYFHLSPSVIKEALELSKSQRISLGQALVKMRVLTPQQFVSLVGEARREAVICQSCGKSYLRNPELECFLCRCGNVLLSSIAETKLKGLINPSPSSDQEAAEAEDTLPSRKLGEFEILEEIGKGGMGVVFKAKHPELDGVVALKLLLRAETATQTQLQRFEREAETARRLNHPNIVKIWKYGTIQGNPYMAMECIEGENLKQLLKRKHPLPLKQCLHWLQEIALAIHHAHQNQVVHRDLKAANILISSLDSSPHITDFGLAKDLNTDAMLTQSGIKIGTPAYMAPEQAEGKSKYATPSTDIYALGVMLFQVLTGKLPFRGKTPAELFYKIIRTPAPDPRQYRQELSPEVSYVCLKAMAKDPQERYPTALAFAEDIRCILQNQPLKSKIPPSSNAKCSRGKKKAASSSQKLDILNYLNAIPHKWWILGVLGFFLLLLSWWLFAPKSPPKNSSQTTSNPPETAQENPSTTPPSFPTPGPNAKQWLHQAKAFQSSGDYEKAKALLARAIKLNPHLWQAKVLLWEVNALENHLPEALQGLRQTLRHQRWPAERWDKIRKEFVSRGVQNYRQGRTTRAFAFLRLVAELGAKKAQIEIWRDFRTRFSPAPPTEEILRLGEFLFAAELYELAAFVYYQASLSDRFSPAYFRRYQCFWMLALEKKGQKALRLAKKFLPEKSFWKGLMRVENLLEKGEYSEAKKQLAQLQALTEEEKIELYLEEAKMHFGDLNHSLEYIYKAKEIAPENRRVRFYEALAYFWSGEYKKSAKLLRRHLRAIFPYSKIYYYLGRSQYYLGKYQEALKSLQKAFDLVSSEASPPPSYHYWRGLVYENLKQWSQARRDFEQFLHRKKGSSLREKVRKKILKIDRILRAN
ncbi:MAG: serine/threonine protein kinase [Planctomycetota bacterium]|nr:MAG: serine/threonine protein kinase [Planctomycetota bacterium]